MQKLESYSVQGLSGRGTFGSVYKAFDERTKRFVAIKQVSDSNELEIMKQLDHPFVCTLYEAVDEYAIMEYAERGTLRDYVNTNGPLEEKFARRIFAQLTCVMQYLHSCKIVHRDIKAENILLDKDLNIRLIDFGLSVIMNDSNKLLDQCGSPDYASPEMLAGTFYDESTDIWSAGVVLYAITVGHLPFHGTTIKETLANIFKSTVDYPKTLSDDLVDLIKGMLTVDPTERLSLENVRYHQWMKYIDDSNYDSLKIKNIDDDLLSIMNSLKMETENISTDLENNNFTSRAAASYRIFRRERINEQLRSQDKPHKVSKLKLAQSTISSPMRNQLSLTKFSKNAKSMPPKNDFLSQILTVDTNVTKAAPLFRSPQVRRRTRTTFASSVATFMTLGE